MSINIIKKRVEELQERLGRELQVTVYNSALNSSDDLLSAARDCRMSLVGEGGKEWQPGTESSSVRAVRVVAEEFGEIPYALMAENVYIEGQKGAEKPAFNDHVMAAAALASAVASMLTVDELERLVVSAREAGRINDEQCALINKQFLE
jgi:hypothetical protein